MQMGIGDGLIPAILNQEIYDDTFIVSDEKAIKTSRDLARKEGIMCGISSGTNVAAALELARILGKGNCCYCSTRHCRKVFFYTII